MNIEYKILEILPEEIHYNYFGRGTLSGLNASSNLFIKKQYGKYEIGYESSPDVRNVRSYFICEKESLKLAIREIAKLIIEDIKYQEEYYERGVLLFEDNRKEINYKDLRRELQYLLNCIQCEPIFKEK
jgi:hypothetical protein